MIIISAVTAVLCHVVCHNCAVSYEHSIVSLYFVYFLVVVVCLVVS